MFEVLTRFEFEDFAFRDGPKALALAIIGFVGLFLALNWIQTNIVGQSQIVAIFFAFLVLAGFAYGANWVKRGVPQLRGLPFGMVGMGYNLKTTALLVLIGVGFGWFLVSQQLTVALPLDVSFNQAQTMDFIYKTIMSPIIEELFRAVMIITVALLFYKLSPYKNWLLSLLVGLLSSSVVFGLFHYLAYQQEFAFIGAAVIFGLVAGLMMMLSKSIAPAIAFHWTNNILIFGDGEPTPIIIAAGITGAILIIAFFRRS